MKKTKNIGTYKNILILLLIVASFISLINIFSNYIDSDLTLQKDDLQTLYSNNTEKEWINLKNEYSLFNNIKIIVNIILFLSFTIVGLLYYQNAKLAYKALLILILLIPVIFILYYLYFYLNISDSLFIIISYTNNYVPDFTSKCLNIGLIFILFVKLLFILILYYLGRKLKLYSDICN